MEGLILNFKYVFHFIFMLFIPLCDLYVNNKNVSSTDIVTGHI
jgi:hypothetical protein